MSDLRNAAPGATLTGALRYRHYRFLSDERYRGKASYAWMTII